MQRSALDTRTASRPKTICGVNPDTRSPVGGRDHPPPSCTAAPPCRKPGSPYAARCPVYSPVRPQNPHETAADEETSMAANARFINPKTLAPPPGYTYVVETTGPG